jgi:receptor expression-enhancing protein 1/2/3/4
MIDIYALSLQGTTYVYGTFFKLYISQHENDIDHNMLELRARATDMVVVYFQKAASMGQNTFFDVLKYVASQSPSQKSRQRSPQVCIKHDITHFCVRFGYWN